LNFNKIVLISFISLFLLSLANADVQINRDMKGTADTNTFMVTLSITPENVDKYDIAEIYPQTWSLISWSVSGNTTPVTFEQQAITYAEKPVNLFHWYLNDNSQIVLTYNSGSTQTISGQDQLTSIVVYPGGFKTDTYMIVLGEGGAILKSISIQAISLFKEYSWYIIAIIFGVVILLLIYHVWKKKKEVEPVKIKKPVELATKHELPKAPKLIPIRFGELSAERLVKEIKPSKKQKKSKIVPKSAKFYKKTMEELEDIEKKLKKER